MLKCCGIRQKSTAFVCDAPSGFLYQRIDFLVRCKQCKRTVMQVTRLNHQNEISTFRRTDDSARELFERMRMSILFKIVAPYEIAPSRGRFYLMYSEFGRKSRCYSNLSALIDVGESLALPEKRVILAPNSAL